MGKEQLKVESAIFQGFRANQADLEGIGFSLSNIAEGFERNNPGDFSRFLTIAKSSCAEVRAQLYVALDVGYLNQGQFSELM